MNDFFIIVPIVNQLEEVGDDYWARRSCALCSLKMLMSHGAKKHRRLDVRNLIKNGLAREGFTEAGWKHQLLVDLAGERGVEIERNFFKEAASRSKGIEVLESELLNSRPVVASMYFQFNPANGGHLVLVNGYKANSQGLEGYHIQDPDPRFRGHNYFVFKEEFLANWRGGLLWLKA